MDRATQGEVEHAIGGVRHRGLWPEARAIMDTFADHGLRVERVSADPCGPGPLLAAAMAGGVTPDGPAYTHRFTPGDDEPGSAEVC